jgi:hypothetical protein
MQSEIVLSGAIKDMDATSPVPTEWRRPLAALVQSISNGTSPTAHEGWSIEAIPSGLVENIRSNINAYGVRGVHAPEGCWNTSRAQWYGDHWDVLIDLWEPEGSATDLVLAAKVRETAGGYRVEVRGVYVP